MAIAISPHYNTNSFSSQLSLENKIDIFIDRVKGWQIQPALEMSLRDIPDKDFAQLAIIISYFEMIGIYISGYLGDFESYDHFALGLRYTFPVFKSVSEDIIKTFYNQVRNGLYHLGLTKSNVIISDHFPGSINYIDTDNKWVISPGKLVQDISCLFNVFSKELINPKNIELRNNFVSRFNLDNPDC